MSTTHTEKSCQNDSNADFEKVKNKIVRPRDKNLTDKKQMRY